jgi:hypothetical protein
MKGLLTILREELPQSKPIVTEGGTSTVDQTSLKGDLELVRKAVRNIPNRAEDFPTRESYRDIGYAIKAALPDHPYEAFDLFQEWCAETDWVDEKGRGNDPAVVEADWRRMKPPYRRGAKWLYDLAHEKSHGSFDKAEQWYEPIVPYEPLFKDDIGQTGGMGSADGDTYEVLRASEILKREPPKFLIERHVPQVSLGFLYSVPGAGKTFAALDAALHIACDLPDWYGDAITADKDAVVLYLAPEGSFGFRNRIKAWLKQQGMEEAPDRFMMIEKTINFMEREDIDKLLRTVRKVIKSRPCLIVVDTVSRALPGADENLQKEMTLFVQACDKLKEAFRSAVLGVHHAGKNGDMRGSTVLLGAGDFVFSLQRKKCATIGQLHCEKQKEAPDGWSEPYRFDLVRLDDGQTSLVPSRADMSSVTVLTPDISALVLTAIDKAWQAGEPWGKYANKGELQAAKRMVKDFGFTVDRAEEVLEVWLQTGVIEEDIVSRKNKKKGLCVVRAVGQEPSNEASVFD